MVIKMICRAKNLGFSLFEIKDLVSKKSEDKKLPITLAYQLINEKISTLNTEAQELQLKMQNLEQFKIDLAEQFT